MEYSFILSMTKWIAVIYAAVNFYDWVIVLIPEFILRRIFNYFHILHRDIRYLSIAWNGIKSARRYEKENITVIKAFSTNLTNFPNRTCLLFEDSIWTNQQVEDYSNRVCWHFGSFVGKNEVVGLFLPNRPEYVCIWLGCAKAGIITSLINTNLRLKTLLHAINVSKLKAIIYSNQYETALSEILNELDEKPKLYSFEGGSTIGDSINLSDAMKSTDSELKPNREINFKDTVLYIFTSGTTGLPKPSKITHSKLIGLALIQELLIGLKDNAVVYSPMPMYHSACTAAVVSALIRPITLVLRTKFSASAYFSDCRKYNVTAAQYIGEMLRYILNTPVNPDDKKHNITLLSGNGVTADIWNKFVRRFDIPNIVEFYGSTEGNFLLANNQNIIGSCGFLPIGIPFYYRFGPSIIRVNKENGEPERNQKGLCTLVEPGEPGLLIGYCPAGNEMRKFHGYVNNSDTQSKIIINVFKHGDSAYNTGDFMVMDNRGWVTFVDRFGDTFRWKGENVSTTEVESIIRSSPFVEDCAVYGVQVGDLEGKAGMASVIMKNMDLDNFSSFLSVSLPPYAQPVFLRLVDSLQYTSTFKVIKGQLRKQSYDIATVPDPLLVKINGKYTPLTKELFQTIQQGQIKL